MAGRQIVATAKSAREIKRRPSTVAEVSATDEHDEPNIGKGDRSAQETGRKSRKHRTEVDSESEKVQPSHNLRKHKSKSMAFSDTALNETLPYTARRRKSLDLEAPGIPSADRPTKLHRKNHTQSASHILRSQVLSPIESQEVLKKVHVPLGPVSRPERQKSLFGWKSGQSLSNLGEPEYAVGATEGAPERDRMDFASVVAAAKKEAANIREKPSLATDDLETPSRRHPIKKGNKAHESRQRSKRELRDKVMGVEIFGADRFVPDVRCLNPSVRVHAVDVNTGMYLPKTSPEAVTESGKYTTSTIRPISTKPFHFVTNNGQCVPLWNEHLIINEPYLTLLNQNTLLLFEVLDSANERDVVQRGRPIPDFYVAWAFLRLVGPVTGELHTEKTTRLQLYQYPSRWTPLGRSNLSLVFEAFKHSTRIKYPSSLYVGIVPRRARREASPTPSSLIEHGQQTKDDDKARQKEAEKSSSGGLATSTMTRRMEWRRRLGQRCQVPNRLMYRIAATNAFACAFSHKGFHLAIGCVNENGSHIIKIHDAVSGTRIGVLEGHLDLVTSLVWLHDDSILISTSADGSVRLWDINANGTAGGRCAVYQHPTFVYTADVQRHPDTSEQLLLATGCFDNLVRLYDLHSSERRHPDENGLENRPATQILRGHESSVNSVVFDHEGTRLYTADTEGYIRVWSSQVQTDENGRLVFVGIKVMDFFKDIPITSIRINPQDRRLLVHLSSDELQSVDVRLYRVITKYVADSHASGEISKTNGSQARISPIISAFIRPTYSPCGNLVLAGAQDGRALVWDSMTGRQLCAYGAASGTRADAKSSLTDAEGWLSDGPIVQIAYHPLDHFACFVSCGAKTPVSVWTWDKDVAAANIRKIVLRNRAADLAYDTPAPPPQTMTSHENIVAATLAVEEKLEHRKREVEAIVDLVKQSFHNLALGIPVATSTASTSALQASKGTGGMAKVSMADIVSQAMSAKQAKSASQSNIAAERTSSSYALSQYAGDFRREAVIDEEEGYDLTPDPTATRREESARRTTHAPRNRRSSKDGGRAPVSGATYVPLKGGSDHGIRVEQDANEHVATKSKRTSKRGHSISAHAPELTQGAKGSKSSLRNVSGGKSKGTQRRGRQQKRSEEAAIPTSSPNYEEADMSEEIFSACISESPSRERSNRKSISKSGKSHGGRRSASPHRNQPALEVPPSDTERTESPHRRGVPRKTELHAGSKSERKRSKHHTPDETSPEQETSTRKSSRRRST